MKPVSRILVALAIFLAVDAAVYLVTAHEFTGGPLIAVTAVAMAFLGSVLWVVSRRAERQVEQEPGEVGAVKLDHVGPTIWPVGFSLAAVIMAAGLAAAWWLLIPGGILFVASAIGWFLDIKTQRTHHATAH